MRRDICSRFLEHQMYLKCSSNLNHSTSLPKPSLIYILPYKTKDMCIAHNVWHTSRTIPKKKYPKSTFLSALCLNVQVHRFWLSSVTYPNLMVKNPNLPPPKKLPGPSPPHPSGGKPVALGTSDGAAIAMAHAVQMLPGSYAFSQKCFMLPYPAK